MILSLYGLNVNSPQFIIEWPNLFFFKIQNEINIQN